MSRGRRFGGWDLLLAAWVGFVAGINEPPWFWETWAVMGVAAVYFVWRVTEDGEA